MKLKQMTTAVLAAMLMTTLNAQAFGTGDPEDTQVAKKTEVRTHVMVVDGEGQVSKMEGKIPEHATMITTNNGNMHFIAAGETIKNAPFTAELSIETIQKLADGNVISHKTSMLNARDSQGKTRRETRNSKGEVTEITIVDPAGSVLTLNPRTKTATKMPDRFQMGKKMPGGMKEINVETIRIARDGGENIEVRAVVGDAKRAEKNIVIKRVGSMDGEMPIVAGAAKDITIDVRGPEAGPAMGMLANAPDGAFMRLFADSKWAAKKQSKSLGTKEMEGVKVDGKFSSYEIPAGEVGNAQAIVVSDEVWTSPELQLVVYSKHSDPRSGDRIYRLSNLKRDEVAASQFTVPTDYKVRDLAKEMKVIINETNEKSEKK